MLDCCLTAFRWRVRVAVLEAEETGTVDMVCSSSQHCGGDGGIQRGCTEERKKLEMSGMRA